MFDDLRSVAHMAAGFAAGVAPFTPMWLLTPIILLVFAVYEVVEKDDPLHTLGDFIEFVWGFILGISIMIAVVLGAAP